MRILTVRQPWAWAIIHGEKNVENRSRNLAGSYRGLIAIHAALSADLLAYSSDHLAQTANRLNAPSLARMPYGAIIGVVKLKDVHHVTKSVRGDAPVCWDDHTPTGEQCSPWGESMRDGWHLELSNPRRLAEPIPYRGSLGLRTLPDELAVQVLAGVV